MIAACRPALPRLALPSLLLTLALAFGWPRPALATFHLNEITKVMVGFEGDASLQAVELKMLFNGEGLTTGKVIRAYNGAGVLVGTLGTFSADMANAIAGRNILIATMKWRQKFGVTPDLQISPGLLVTSGQVSFEDPGICTVDALAYGAVSTFLVGTTAAPPLPSGGASVMVRSVDNDIAPACPLATNSGSQFFLTTAGPTHPVTFTNNAGVSANVASTATAVEVSPSPVARFVIAPNPVRTSARVEASSPGRIAVYDLQGRRVRVILAGGGSGPVRAEWDGRDDRGRPLASGVYFIRQDAAGAPLVRRFVIAR